MTDLPPIFIGGSGRSGTTIAARLIGASELYEMVPIEATFHVAPLGLSDFIAGEVDVDTFENTTLTKWYRRHPGATGDRGLHVIISMDDLQVALQQFRLAAEHDRSSAAGDLLRAIFDPVAAKAGKTSWVEMSPPVIKVADRLAEAMPTARFIHMTRYGRDVASSVVKRQWGPNDMQSALDWWVDEMLAAQRALDRIGSERSLVIRVEDLVGDKRKEVFRLLSEFIQANEDQQMRQFFETVVTSGKAHIGRWRQGRDAHELAIIEGQYEVALARIQAAGVVLPPVE
jgi:hypothetical protein